jgi:hypothetical protein
VKAVRKLAIVSLIIGILAACGPQGEIDPVPTPLARPDEDRVLLSASESLEASRTTEGEGLVAVVGLPQALEPDVRVVVENTAGTIAVEARVNEDGSFAASVPAAANDHLRVFARKRPEGEAPIDGAALELTVPAFEDGVNPPKPKETSDEHGIVADLIHTHMEGDQVVVVGDAGCTDEGLEIVVANVASSHAVTTLGLVDGRFETRLPGRLGDTLAIFSRWPESAGTDPGSSSETVIVTVSQLP